MNRREALSAVSFLLGGGAIIGADVFLSGCKQSTSPLPSGVLDLDAISFLDEVGETILPTTTTSPGAKAAKIGEFMNSIVSDCYAESEQQIFTEGITKFKDAAKNKSEKDFMEMTPEERHQFLLGMEDEVKAYRESKKPEDPEHYYTMIKQLTLWGYFSSEIGATQALRHLAVPGHYDACVPLEKGQKAWAI